MTWATKRSEPYSEQQMKRQRCIRCGDRAKQQWQICADNNNYRPVCIACDLALNLLVLKWMGHPKATELARVYAARLEGKR